MVRFRPCTRQSSPAVWQNFFDEMTPKEDDNNDAIEVFLKRKADSREDIEQLQHQCQTLKEQRKNTAHHITVDELPEEDRFQQTEHPCQTFNRHH